MPENLSFSRLLGRLPVALGEGSQDAPGGSREGPGRLQEAPGEDLEALGVANTPRRHAGFRPLEEVRTVKNGDTYRKVGGRTPTAKHQERRTRQGAVADHWWWGP